MDVYTAIQKRRSIRKFKDRKVPEEALEKVLNAGRLAPSAVNLQPWRFIVTRNPEIKRSLAECTRGGKHGHLAMGNVAIVACGNERDCYQRHGDYMKTFAIDTALALDHMMLAATAEGLATCWIGAFNEKKVKELLQIPDPWRVVGMTPVGYPDEAPEFTGRKTMLEIISYDRWQ